jgi:hypothetical protein
VLRGVKNRCGSTRRSWGEFTDPPPHHAPSGKLTRRSRRATRRWNNRRANDIDLDGQALVTHASLYLAIRCRRGAHIAAPCCGGRGCPPALPSTRAASACLKASARECQRATMPSPEPCNEALSACCGHDNVARGSWG